MESAILVRHAESVFGVRGLVNGRVDVRCPLTMRGVAQARALADELAGEEIDLCVTSQLQRTQETADIALSGRTVPRVVVPELNDPLYGDFESGPLDAYLAWALENDSGARPPGGGEARQALVARYAAAFRHVLERPDRSVLVVTHSLPIAYVLAAISGRAPSRRVPLIECAKRHVLTADRLREAVARLEAWCETPTW